MHNYIVLVAMISVKTVHAMALVGLINALFPITLFMKKHWIGNENLTNFLKSYVTSSSTYRHELSNWWIQIIFDLCLKCKVQYSH